MANRSVRHGKMRLVSVLAPAILAGCAGFSPGTIHRAPVESAEPQSARESPQGERRPHDEAPDYATVAARAADIATRMVGRPYRWGGEDPETGFDCSGLILFSFREAGVSLPRTTYDQRDAANPVSRYELRRGDLLFFDQDGQKDSHAGIYVGRGWFVHAPSSGKQVRRDRLDSPYWRRHFSQARRVEGL